MTRMTIPPAAFALTSPYAAMAQEIAPAERAAYQVNDDNLADAFKKGRRRKQEMTGAKVATPA